MAALAYSDGPAAPADRDRASSAIATERRLASSMGADHGERASRRPMRTQVRATSDAERWPDGTAANTACFECAARSMERSLANASLKDFREA